MREHQPKRWSRAALAGLTLCSLLLVAQGPATAQGSAEGPTTTSTPEDVEDLRSVCTSIRLDPGDIGRCVGLVEELLGLADDGVGRDAIYDLELVRVITCMQEAMDLFPDGVIGSATWSALLAPEPAAVDLCVSDEEGQVVPPPTTVSDGSSTLAPPTTSTEVPTTSSEEPATSTEVPTTSSEEPATSTEVSSEGEAEAGGDSDQPGSSGRGLSWLWAGLLAAAAFVAGLIIGTGAMVLRQRSSAESQLAKERHGEEAPDRGPPDRADAMVVEEESPLEGTPPRQPSMVVAAPQIRSELAAVRADSVPPGLQLELPAGATALSTLDPIGVVLLDGVGCAIVARLADGTGAVVAGQKLSVVGYV